MMKPPSGVQIEAMTYRGETFSSGSGEATVVIEAEEDRLDDSVCCHNMEEKLTGKQRITLCHWFSSWGREENSK